MSSADVDDELEVLASIYGSDFRDLSTTNAWGKRIPSFSVSLLPLDTGSRGGIHVQAVGKISKPKYDFFHNFS